MSNLMTHLQVAKNIYNLKHFPINDLPQFYLGVAAPDAVHNRLNYISDHKKAAHLCVGDERWGMISNNEEWTNNVLSFINSNKKFKDFDFLLGYCLHILTDIYNNIKVWLPFKQKYQGELWSEYGGLYHKESGMVEIVMALDPQNKDDFWSHLQCARAQDFFDLVYNNEIEKQKDYILYDWYVNKEISDTSLNKVVSLDSTRRFIEEATEYTDFWLSKIKF